MKRINTLLALFTCFAFSFQSNAQTTINDTLIIDGLSRNYILYEPAIYDGSVAVPLVINMHGYTSNSVQQMFYGDFKNLQMSIIF